MGLSTGICARHVFPIPKFVTMSLWASGALSSWGLVDISSSEGKKLKIFYMIVYKLGESPIISGMAGCSHRFGYIVFKL